jgi:hypothetical protein
MAWTLFFHDGNLRRSEASRDAALKLACGSMWPTVMYIETPTGARIERPQIEEFRNSGRYLPQGTDLPK